MRRLMTLLALMPLTSAALAQNDVEITTIEVADNTYMLQGSGGNIGIYVGQDGVIMIDDQFAPLSERIQTAISEITGAEVQFLINTHWHGDHTGGNENFAEDGAIIVAHNNVRRRMSMEVFLPLFDSRTPPSPIGALPVVTFTQDITFHPEGETVHVFHVESAHTDGDSIVHFENANVIHMGDTLWTSGYPRFDPNGGGSIDGMIAAVEQAAALADDNTRFVPGHGDLPEAGTAAVEEYLDMLNTIRDRIADLIDQGMSEMEVIRSRPTEDFDEQWGNGYMTPELFTRIVYTSLAQ